MDTPDAQRTPTLTVYMGPPGAGKTTHARANRGGAHLLSADVMRRAPHAVDPAMLFHVLLARAQAHLIGGEDVVVDACNIHPVPRRAFLKVGRACRARTRLVVLYVSLQEALDVQTVRAYPVPRDRVVSYCRRFRSALRDARHEGWDEIEVVRRR